MTRVPFMIIAPLLKTIERIIMTDKGEVINMRLRNGATIVTP